MSGSSKRISHHIEGASSSSKQGALTRFSDSIRQSTVLYHGRRIASDTGFAAKKLAKSTGRAAWIVGTTFIILAVPLIIAMDREQQLNELEMQQASLLGTPSFGSSPPPSK